MENVDITMDTDLPPAIAAQRGRVRGPKARRGRDSGDVADVEEGLVFGYAGNDGVRRCPVDVPLEVPQRPIRRRLYVPSRAKRLALPSVPLQPVPYPSAAPDEPVASTSSGELVASTSAAPQPASPVPSKVYSPSLRFGGKGRVIGPKRALTEEKLECNLGSEDEESDGEDVVRIEPSVSRALQVFIDDPFDAPTQDAEPDPIIELPVASSPEEGAGNGQLQGPLSLFQFEWRDFPETPLLSSSERREVFSEENCGPTAPYPTPYDAFGAIWNREIMEYIVTETNRYAWQFMTHNIIIGTLREHSRLGRWSDTNVDELYVYFGLVLATGMCVKSDIQEYWAKGDYAETPGFRRYMSRDRFLLLTRCLHFNNNESADLETLTRTQAKLFKIAPIIDHLNTKFQTLYRLNRNIALDESLMQRTGWLDIKQYISNKATSVGIKTYEVCEAQSGYLWRFKVHAGRDEVAAREETPVSGVTASLVLDLLKGLENEGHTVWMDSYYNSPGLARVLKSLRFDCVGTLRTNRQCVPSELNLNKSKMTVGQVVGKTSGDVDIVVWRDCNRVSMISTYHGNAASTVSGKTRPTVVHDYNLCMGGVDKKDQMLSMFPIERKRTQVWYKKFFKRLLNVSILNAYIMYKQSPGETRTTRERSHRNFRHSLITSIFERHKMRPVEPGPVGAASSLTPIFPPEMLKHLPKEYGLVNRTDRTYKEKVRRSCVVCHKRVSSYCPTCNVPLCVYECIGKYHSEKLAST